MRLIQEHPSIVAGSIPTIYGRVARFEEKARCELSSGLKLCA